MNDGALVVTDYASTLDRKAREIHRLATRKFVENENHDRESGNAWGSQGVNMEPSVRLPIEEGDAEWRRIDAGFDWVDSAFDSLKKIADPDVAGQIYDKMVSIAGADQAASGVTSSGNEARGVDLGVEDGSLKEPGLYEDIGDSLATGWEGHAADSFNAFFSKVPTATGSQAMVAKVLRDGMDLNRHLLAEGRKDAVKVADDTITALEASGPSVTVNSTTMLGIAAAAFTIAAGIATVPAGAIAGGLTMFAGAASGMASLDASKAKEQRIGGPHVEAILDSMMDAIFEVDSIKHQAETDLAGALNDSNQHILDTTYGSGSDRFKYVAPRPGTLVDNNDGDPYADFRPRNPP